MQEQWGADLEAIIRVMQAALAPAFLLASVTGLLNVFTGRLGRAIDRSRELQRLVPAATAAERAALTVELDIVTRRKRLIRGSMLLSVTAAVIICTLIALLFVMGLSRLSVAWLIVLMFAASTGLIASSLLVLLWETSLAAKVDGYALQSTDDAATTTMASE